mmetsp:Transcript_11007/g.31087  ORF Transcript_11007/g.31087 Transcript_11007/m.31087 type:complete len:345 (-) Transcript_11007:1085-2119(-)
MDRTKSAWQPRHRNGRQQRRPPHHAAGTGNPHGVCLCHINRYRADELAGGQALEHTLRLSEVQPGLTLLGNHAQFCHAYWHIPETPEAPHLRTPSCLRSACRADGHQCAGKGVVLVARLTAPPSEDGSSAGDLYVARYSNCPDNEHAEVFFLRDQQLRSHLPAACGGRLLLYLNKQPCHHSSDHLRASSCTLSLLEFADKELRPLGIDMEVIITYTYRAHWELENLSPSQQQRYGPAIVAAREGLGCFGRRSGDGVVMRATQKQDWKWLVAQCDKAVQQDFAEGEGGIAEGRFQHFRAEGGIFNAEQLEARAGMDSFVQQVISGWDKDSADVQSIPACAEVLVK